MTSLPEQISAARQAQLDQGITLIRSLGDQALDRTSRVFSLQLDASRAAVEHSSNAVRQLLAARDPRDLLALGSQSQQHLRTLLDYGHELFSIATSGLSLPMLGNQGAAAPAPTSLVAVDTAPPPARAEQVAAEAFERIGGDTASVAASVADSAPAPASSFVLPTDAAPAATLSVVTSDVEPGAEPTVIAKAASEALDAPVAVPHPVAASMPVDVAVEIELPKVEPVDATPPPAATTVRPVETRGTKGRKKHS